MVALLVVLLLFRWAGEGTEGTFSAWRSRIAGYRTAVQALKLLPGLVDVFKALAFWEM